MLSFALQTTSTWDGEQARTDEVANLTVSETSSGLVLGIDAPYHADPAPSSDVGSLWKLWDWEVVELFLLGSEDHYVEIEVGPHGHYLALLLEGERNIVGHGYVLDVTTSIVDSRWNATVHIPSRLLPSKPWRANAYAIHGVDTERRYLAMFPVPGPQPDYHRLAFFRSVDQLDAP
jgi:hypothetical protein